MESLCDSQTFSHLLSESGGGFNREIKIRKGWGVEQSPTEESSLNIFSIHPQLNNEHIFTR